MPKDSSGGAPSPGRVRNLKEINSTQVKVKSSSGQGVLESQVPWRRASMVGGGVWASPQQS